MSYLSAERLEELLGDRTLRDLADRDRDGIADREIVEAALDQARAVIDAQLGSRFELPLTQVPALLETIAARIARYQLSGDHVTDRTKADYEEALMWLGQAREGKLDLGLTPKGEELKTTSGGPMHAGGRPVF
ncbi:MAG: phage protein Gp36 family protein, partial [Pseudomonadota bacterium]